MDTSRKTTSRINSSKSQSQYLLNGSQDVDRDMESKPFEATGTLLLLDDRILTRECLSQSIVAHDIGLMVAGCGSEEDWNRISDEYPPVKAVLIAASAQRITDEKYDELQEIVSKFHPAPVLLLAESDELEQIVRALECGFKGYVPSSVGIAVCAEAIRLALVGGLYVPSSSVMAMRHYVYRKSQSRRPISSMFTQRQAEVVQALRKGKANKIIAYELNMRESTVKVHIRNIMKKLKATNRTEVAYKINDLFPEESRAALQ